MIESKRVNPHLSNALAESGLDENNIARAALYWAIKERMPHHVPFDRHFYQTAVEQMDYSTALEALKTVALLGETVTHPDHEGDLFVYGLALPHSFLVNAVPTSAIATAPAFDWPVSPTRVLNAKMCNRVQW